MKQRKMIKTVLIASALAVFMPIAALATTDSATYTYDSLGRVHILTYASGKTITYTYDAQGNFVSEVSN